MDSLENWRKTHYVSEIIQASDKIEVTLMGWLRELRLHGKIAFLILADRSGDCQITASESASQKLFDIVKSLNREDVIAVKGVVSKTSQTKRGVEVLLKDIRVLNKSITPLPLEITEKTPAFLDTRLDSRVLDLRKPKVFAIFKVRNQILSSAREYFAENGFMEIETPKIIATATEGGAALFPVSYFETDAFLRQSPQLYKELMTACFEKVFEIGTVFRAEPSNTPRHLTEVTQLDIEMGFATEQDTWAVLEELIQKIYRDISEKCENELELLGQKINVPKIPFKKISYTEALGVLNKNKAKLKFGEDIPPAGEKELTELYQEPLIVNEYPDALKPHYIAPHEKDKKLTYGFDLIMDGMEIASGGRRIHSAEQYIQRLKEKGLNPAKFEEIIKFYKYGMPPHSGWAIGIDRLTQIICGLQNVREAVLFPRDVKRLKP